MVGMKSVGLNVPRCYVCKAIDGVKGAFVSEVSAEEALIKKVPVGVALCTDCAVLTEEETALLNLVGDDDRQMVNARRKEIAEEERLDLEHEAKEWAAWSNTFGGW